MARGLPKQTPLIYKLLVTQFLLMLFTTIICTR